MPIPEKGLKGLPGLNSVSEAERQQFYLNNDEKLKKYKSPGARRKAAEALYDNQMFIGKFGQDAFDQAVASGYGREQRNKALEETVVNEAFDDAYKPVKGKKVGAGDKWGTISELSTEGKKKLLESGWRTPEEMKKEQQSDNSTFDTVTDVAKALWTPLDFIAEQIPGVGKYRKALNPVTHVAEAVREGINQYNRGQNDKILEKIYNDEADGASKRLGTQVSQAYFNPEITGKNDADTKKKFYEAITPSRYNLGIAEYASHWGKGTEDDITSEMEDFSIDDMRQVLAKKAVYDQYMSPQMAATALNNEAKRYITERQSGLKRFGLFAKDVGIASMSYTADKINGIYNLGLIAADQLSDAGLNAPKPVVFVDDRGNIIDPKKTKLVQDKNGLFYIDQEGEGHSVHKEQLDRSTLHNMGKSIGVFDEAGSEDDTVLNPQYWTRAEQFGTLDKDEQKQYEKYGSSPYKVSYNPNEDSDLWYESFKMMSFGIADAASQLIPYGVGMAGKALSSANNVGKVVRGLGKGMDVAGKYLTAQTRTGQIIQGEAGALGIAYAYERGAFQETLAQNLAKAEELNYNMSKQEVEDAYKNDASYKAQVDTAIKDMAASMKADYVAQMYNEGKSVISSSELDEAFRAKATEYVLNKLTQEKTNENKGTDKYAALQQDAINKAGNAAVITFLPEAIKYGIVNTVGFRKWLYTNPAGLKKSLSPVLKGLKEATTKDGLKRLTTDASKFETAANKAKQFGKVLRSQAWGGAWTNGTDDMMVDAAERVASDNYQNSLDSYRKGEAIADTYGFIDGIYSYYRGLGNSLGQETTWQATAVGGLGSIVSASPNMVNIAHLATKQGRQDFKNNFGKRYVYETDESGVKRVKKDENGRPITEDIAFADNWRERFNYFIQNGVLNTYYGNKQSERELQNHADYVNNILDDYDDFRAISDFVNSDISRDNATDIKDKKTENFKTAIRLMNVLEHLGKDKSDPAVMSSVVQGMQDFIDKADAYNQGNKEAFAPEEINQLLNEYTSANPQFVRGKESDAAAFGEIMKNAQKLKEAQDAYNEAEKQVQKVEATVGYKISPAVREDLKMKQALNGHWKERVDKMKEEINDQSSERPLDHLTLIATLGGKKRANTLVKSYDKVEAASKAALDEAVAEAQKALDKYNSAQEELRKATTSDEVYQAQEKVKTTKAEYDNALTKKEYVEDIITNNEEKKAQLEEALVEWSKEDKSKVLTADEIFALPVTDRARMMSPENRGLYSKSQQKQIDILEKKLNIEAGNDALQKIQDIASLTQLIARNEDAYNRISKNPDAAAVEFEQQEEKAAKQAYDIITHRNAQTLVGVVNEAVEGLSNREGVKSSDIGDVVYRMLRKHNPKMLDIIDQENLLPDYSSQIVKAKDWSNAISDIDAVVDTAAESQEWKTDIGNKINNIIESAEDRAGIMTNLEKAVDIEPELEKVLDALTNLNYQRDSVVVEARKERQEREAEAKRKEEERKAKEEKVKKKAEERRKQLLEEAKKKPSSTEASSLEDVNLEDESSTEEQRIITKAVSKSGKEVSGSYTVSKDQDGFTHVKRGGGPIIAQRKIIPSEMEGLGISIEDILGKKEDYSTPENYDTLEKIYNEDGFRIEGMTIRPDGTVAINHNEAYFELQGDKAQKFLDKVFPELSQTKEKTSEEEKAIEIKEEDVEEKKPIGESLAQQNEEISVSNGVVKNTNGEMEGKSPTLEEQVTEAKGTSGVQEIDDSKDVEKVNEKGEADIEYTSDTLSGNAMSAYNRNDLKQHKITYKKGDKPNDNMNKFYAWMKNEGINLDNIIDDELPKMLANNSHMKLKFLAIRPENNAIHDGDMKTHLMLVVDYDDTINKGITSIHKESNGGVVTSNGKKYLLVGTVGYGKSETKRALKDILFNNDPKLPVPYGLVKKNIGEFWRNNPSERFYVHPTLETEIVPNSMIPGYLVRESEEYDHDYRRISELLDSPEMNPHSLTLGTLGWGLQYISRYSTVNVEGDKVMSPQKNVENAGRAFVAVPAGNGKYVSAYIRPLMFGDEAFNKDSALYDEITGLLRQVLSPNYEDRARAMSELVQILHLSSEENGDNILIGTDKISTVTLKHGKNTIVTYDLRNAVDPNEFIEAVKRMNPRINITLQALQSIERLKKLDEIGALTIDLIKLGTAGVSYSIYALNENGEMIKPTATPSIAVRTDIDGSSVNPTTVQVPYENGVYYDYNKDTQRFYLNGVEVTNPRTIEGLGYAMKIGQLSPSKTVGEVDYYVLESGENPVVVKKDARNKIERLSEEKAKEMIEQIIKEEETKKREIALDEALKKEGKEVNTNTLSEVIEMDEDTGSLNFFEKEDEAEREEKKKKGEKEEEEVTTKSQPQETSVEGSRAKSKTQTVDDVIMGPNIMKLMTLVREKWNDVPSSPSKLSDFLEKKGVNINNIGTSEADFNAWLHTIECL